MQVKSEEASPISSVTSKIYIWTWMFKVPNQKLWRNDTLVEEKFKKISALKTCFMALVRLAIKDLTFAIKVEPALTIFELY